MTAFVEDQLGQRERSGPAFVRRKNTNAPFESSGVRYESAQTKVCAAEILVGGGSDADKAAAAATVFKLDVTGNEREERIVLALTDVFARLVLGAALANQNRAGVDELSAETLYAEPLSVRIAAVC
jgi:hypothetical protein